MKLTLSRRLSLLALTLFAPLIALTAPAIAANEGQIEGGNIYRVRNVTKGTDFTDPVNAIACERVQYKVRIHNPGPGELSQVNVQATLPASAATSNTSTVTVSSQNASPASTSDTAVVNFPTALSLTYLPGSTQLLDANDGLLRGLPDGITAGGVNIGNVGVSIAQKRFVQFSADVNCPTPTPTPTPTPSYSCDAFDITANNNRTVNVAVFTTSAANGAVYKSADINWGDGKTDSAVTNVVGSTHTYGADGSYTLQATAHFTVDGKDVTAAGAQCAEKVTFKTNETPVVIHTISTNTSSTITVGGNTSNTTNNSSSTTNNQASPATNLERPTALVNTGAGSVATLFAVATIAGTLGHRFYLGRRFNS
ncbi:MAG: hypothetical protein QFB86_02690 [Patescibacteria group bacterium]|nr:hypothetical protein [Patescibacteria group bacterium]